MRGKRAVAAFACAALATAGAIATPSVAQTRGPKVTRNPGTQAPAFVRGVTEQPRRGGPSDVARGHLKRNAALYEIDVSSLRDLGVSRHSGVTTARFGQTHHGIEVFGATYLVHMKKHDGGYATTSANGDYFTELNVPSEPRISEEEALTWARLRTRPLQITRVTHNGLKVLPLRTGALTYHFTLLGTRYGRPVKLETFVNATSGTLVLTFDNLQRTEIPSGPINNALGDPVTFTVNGQPNGPGPYTTHQLRIPSVGIETYRRSGNNTFGSYKPGTFGISLTTSGDNNFTEHVNSGAVDAHYNTEKVDIYFKNLAEGGYDPITLQEMRGDGKVISTVNVTDPFTDGPFYNAFWSGAPDNQMVYGNPGNGLYPLSAGLDIVAHELTHGLDQALVGPDVGLLYINQSGAMNEAYSDYFGEAAEITINNEPMDDESGRMGEDVCISGSTPEWPCPLRDFDPEQDPNLGDSIANGDDYPHTSEYHYLLMDVDNGGVHENSGPFAGALWDIRKALADADPVDGAKRADQYILGALARATPYQNFYGGRQALLDAVDDIAPLVGGNAATEKPIVTQEFADHGITSTWANPSSSSGRLLYKDIVPIGDGMAAPQVSGNRFVVGNYKRKLDIYGPLGIFVGRTDCARCRKVSVGESGAFSTYSDENPDIHGKRAVWTHITRNFRVDVHGRVLGRRVANLAGGSGLQWYPTIDGAGRRGTILAWENVASAFADTDIKYRFLGKPVRTVFADRRGEQIMPQASGVWVAWWDLGPGFSRKPKIGVKNVVTGRTFIFKPPTNGTFMGPPSLSGTHLYWYQDSEFYNPSNPNSGQGTIVRVRLGSRSRQKLFSERASLAPEWEGFTLEPMPSANRRFVTWSDEHYLDPLAAGLQHSKVGRDIYMLRLGTRRIRRVTSNRGDQAFPVMVGRGDGVLWLDASRSFTDVRFKP